MTEPFFSRRSAMCLIAALWPVVASAAPPASAASAGNLRLRDTRWVLQSLNGAPVARLEQGAATHLVLHAASQHLSGFAGCNGLRGRYTQRGTQLALSALASTRKVCSPPLMQQEQRFIELLGSADAYRIEGQTLSLLQGEVVRLSFKAAGRN